MIILKNISIVKLNNNIININMDKLNTVISIKFY